LDISYGEKIVDRNIPECTFGVDVQTLSLAAAHVEWQLARYRKGVADLALARSELSEDLRDRASLDATSEESVQLLRPSRDGYQLAPALVHLRRGREAHRHELLD
jgi:hypothetical protein